MEKLVAINIAEMAQYIPNIREAIDDIHESGIVHNDLSPSNLMLNHQGVLTVIDFGHAGHIGQEIPPHKTKGKDSTRNVFSVDIEQQNLCKLIDICIRKGQF
ncbi:MAG: hypothetical protein M1817_001391 [Caeruleum heppii]|nr:MAG: hypothetical protein M1817_001391 [Caeruleum heppii]